MRRRTWGVVVPAVVLATVAIVIVSVKVDRALRARSRRRELIDTMLGGPPHPGWPLPPGKRVSSGVVISEARLSAAYQLALVGRSPRSFPSDLFLDGKYMKRFQETMARQQDSEDVVRAFLEILERPGSPTLRVTAARGLTFAQEGRPHVTDALARLVRDEESNSDLRAAAAYALASGNGGQRALEATADALQVESCVRVPNMLLAGLMDSGWLYGPTRGNEDKQWLSDKLFERTAGLARRSKREAVRGIALFSLRPLGPISQTRQAALVEVLRSALREEASPRMRGNAARYLREFLERPEAVEALTRAAEADPDALVRSRAQKSLDYTGER